MQCDKSPSDIYGNTEMQCDKSPSDIYGNVINLHLTYMEIPYMSDGDLSHCISVFLRCGFWIKSLPEIQCPTYSPSLSGNYDQL